MSQQCSWLIVSRPLEGFFFTPRQSRGHDAGRCNDPYSLAVIALKLKEIFGLEDINNLLVICNLAWYEQKASIELFHRMMSGGRIRIPSPIFRFSLFLGSELSGAFLVTTAGTAGLYLIFRGSPGCKGNRPFSPGL